MNATVIPPNSVMPVRNALTYLHLPSGLDTDPSFITIRECNNECNKETDLLSKLFNKLVSPDHLKPYPSVFSRGLISERS